MKSNVWFAPITSDEPSDSLAQKAVQLTEAAGLTNMVNANGLVGILQHVGEGNNTGFVKPPITRAVADVIRQPGGKPFLTGSATLYTGRRSNACDHTMQAYDHGFTPDAIDCPIIMCDGLRGADRVAIEVPTAKHCSQAYLGSAVSVMDGLVVMSHPTGHPSAGFAAALKNVAMGLSSRGGKMDMHHGGLPTFVKDKCTECGRCVAWCPAHSVKIDDGLQVDTETWIGGGPGPAVCPHSARPLTLAQR